MSGKDSFVKKAGFDKQKNPLILKYTNISDDSNKNMSYQQLDVSEVDVLNTGCSYTSNPVNRLVGINLSLKDMSNIDNEKVSTVVRDLYFNDICYPGSILPGIEIIQENKDIYLVIKMIAYEKTLKQYLDEKTELDSVFKLIFQELDRIIKLGVHHNDFHSDNIMVTNSSQGMQVNIIDFGDSICINHNNIKEAKMSKLYNLIKLRFRHGSGLQETHKEMINSEITKILDIKDNIIQKLEKDSEGMSFLMPQKPNELLEKYNDYFSNTQTGGNNNKKYKSHKKKSKRKKMSNTKRSVKGRKYKKHNRRSKSKRYQRKKSQ